MVEIDRRYALSAEHARFQKLLKELAASDGLFFRAIAPDVWKPAIAGDLMFDKPHATDPRWLPRTFTRICAILLVKDIPA